MSLTHYLANSMTKHQVEINEYCERLSSNQSSILYELERESNLKTLAPQMISGHLQGRVLSMLSKMLSPKHILEIGTFTGYATICLAEGLAPDGQITTIEGNEELEYLGKKYFKKAGIDQQVNQIIGDAKTIVKTLEGPFDMVFIDAGKRDYALYFDLLIDKVSSGGLLLADNVLWSGKIITDAITKDKDTQMLHDFNQKIKDDPRVENVIVPLRDGLTMIRKL